MTFQGGYLVSTVAGVHDGLSTAVAHLAGGEAGIAQEPLGDWLESEEIVSLSDANDRYLGYPVALWQWDFIRPASRAALRAYCAGASQELYIETVNNENEFRDYRAILHWPEEHPRSGYDRSVKWNFVVRFSILEDVTP